MDRPSPAHPHRHAKESSDIGGRQGENGADIIVSSVEVCEDAGTLWDENGTTVFSGNSMILLDTSPEPERLSDS